MWLQTGLVPIYILCRWQRLKNDAWIFFSSWIKPYWPPRQSKTFNPKLLRSTYVICNCSDRGIQWTFDLVLIVMHWNYYYKNIGSFNCDHKMICFKECTYIVCQNSHNFILLYRLFLLRSPHCFASSPDCATFYTHLHKFFGQLNKFG